MKYFLHMKKVPREYKDRDAPTDVLIVEGVSVGGWVEGVWRKTQQSHGVRKWACQCESSVPDTLFVVGKCRPTQHYLRCGKDLISFKLQGRTLPNSYVVFSVPSTLALFQAILVLQASKVFWIGIKKTVILFF